MVICKICGLKKEPYHRQKYHYDWNKKISKTLMGHFVTKETKDLISKNCIGKTSGKNNGRYNKNRITIKENYFFDLDEREFIHRQVMEKKLGRKLKKNEIVHHINKDTFDNQFSNFTSLTFNISRNRNI